MPETGSVLPAPAEKRSYVRGMFTAIAPHYDRMNRLMALGRDQAWRRTVVQLCALPARGRLLDVATGTGDIAYEALRRHPEARVAGLDLARAMMLRGRGKLGGLDIPFTEGDAQALPFADDTFDAACSGFMMRNVPDVPAAFAEQARVVRAGGRVVCLEMTRPRQPIFRRLFDLYFFGLVPRVGGLISGQRQAYTYLPHSTIAFPPPESLAEIMRAAGLHDVHFRLAMLGTVAIHWGSK
jgi:demethylmenaquinone methyltransferase / 2-methoxy-6-polyprenyl-1,4-benzoquinol methylase